MNKKNPLKYIFQFNNDVESCCALQAMLIDKWEIENFFIKDGYSWFCLINWYK